MWKVWLFIGYWTLLYDELRVDDKKNRRTPKRRRSGLPEMDPRETGTMSDER